MNLLDYHVAAPRVATLIETTRFRQRMPTSARASGLSPRIELGLLARLCVNYCYAVIFVDPALSLARARCATGRRTAPLTSTFFFALLDHAPVRIELAIGLPRISNDKRVTWARDLAAIALQPPGLREPFLAEMEATP
eukprot:1448906-Pyramimonas_sp.AAC.1